MEERMIYQHGIKNIYIEQNKGIIYIYTGNHYVEETSDAFSNGSYPLLDYAPTIEPVIPREEVRLILEWIKKKAPSEKSARLALLYGKAGIGKSVVMHNLLEQLQTTSNYLVLGLKSDQIEFVDTDELSKKIHLKQPLEVAIKEMAQNYTRVVLLVDQIDALSLSLSSNRTPLRSLLQLIEKIKNIPHVRVVISCRPYDLEYDPQLNNLRIGNKWELKELPKEQVLKTLQENQNKERLSDNLLRFLGNPLHLYLFLKVKPDEQLTDPLSTDLLYHQLWRKYINDDSVRKVNKEKLLALLDALTAKMYQRQELAVHIRTFETQYNTELEYLFSNELLIRTKSGQVQFFHQTLFDYVYARRFVEKGLNLLTELKRQHQGLFSRASVKSILTFLREQDVDLYLQYLEQLLYAKEAGKSIYRYHLKSLALSNMAFFESPLPEELNFISTKVYMDKLYMNVVLESVYTPNWFTAIWEIVDDNGGWKKLSKDYKEKLIVMCQRTLGLNTDIVLDKLNTELDLKDEEDRKYLVNLLQYNDLNCRSDKLIDYYNKLIKTRNPLEYTYLLKNILKENPVFVCEELKENVRLQLKEKNYIYKIEINYEVTDLYEELLKKHHDVAVQLLADILMITYESTQFELKESEILNSTGFFNFKRTTGKNFTSNLIEDSANILIDDFLENIDSDYTKRYIAEFSKSKHAGFVFIALYIYTSHPERFKDDIHNIIINRQVLANAPSWVEYQTIEALRVSFLLMTNEQKNNIVERILTIDDKMEHRLFKDVIKARLQYGRPILNIDWHKGKALEVIPIKELKHISEKAYQERLRIERKFNKEYLKNSKPSSISSHIGWTSLKEEQGLKMSHDTWLNSMLKYNIDPHEWDRPSLTGQCHLFRNVVSKEPDKFLKLINQTIQDKRILIDYPLAGMQGLLDANRLNDAMHILKGILGIINNDVNSTERGFSIHSLLLALNDVVKQDHVPEIVIQLLCNALINANEPKEDIHQNDIDVYNIGINQPRGNAGYMLVECAHEDQYKEKIFQTLESISETASVYTRAAILLNLAVLNWLDQNRNVSLFKKLMYDFDPRLMAMPIHNYNPLIYFINYALDDLMNFFNHAADCPKCYKAQVVVLWLAWSHNNRNEQIKVLLDRMCETSQEARLSLLHFLSTLDKKINKDAIDYILYFMEPQFDTKEMGEACDNLFHHIDNWPENLQYQVTNTYVNSPLSRHQIRTFITFLGGFAIKNPVQALRWLEQIINTDIPDDYFIWNRIVDVVIQSYNGIKSFNKTDYQNTLEHAMDLIDTIMQNPSNKYLISNFINKLDNE